MLRSTIPLDELVAYLFGADRFSLASEVEPSLLASARFRAFAETYRDKIRKKVRGLRDDEGRHDLAFELAVARRLLEDRRFTVAYEPYGMEQRAPDFRVTYRTRIHFTVEVRRLRAFAPATGAVDAGRVWRAVADKLGQLPPGMINVLVLGGPAGGDALDAAMRGLLTRAASKDDAFFAARGFRGTRDFQRHYQRLSGVVWLTDEHDTAVTLWRNGQARHPLPADLSRALALLAP